MAIERVAIDTSALYALASDKDDFHFKAELTFQELIDDKAELFVSSYTLVETIALIHRRMGYSRVETFIEAIKDDLYIIWVGGQLHWKAWDFYKERKGRGLSYVDCTTVVLAKDLEAKVFAFDEGFVREGVPVIPQNTGA